MIKDSLILISIIFLSCNNVDTKNVDADFYNNKSIGKMDSIELSDGTTIKCRALTKEQFESLLKSDNVSFLKEYKERYSINVYWLNNGELLVNEGEYYTLYFKLSDLDKLLSQTDIGNSAEVLLNKNPYGKEFATNAKILSKKLTDFFSVLPSNDQDGFLKMLDIQIDSLPNAQEFKREHFISILATIGEALIIKYNANWEMELGSDGVTWNPYLRVRGKRVQYFVYLYEDVFLKEDHRHTLSEIYLTMSSIIERNL